MVEDESDPGHMMVVAYLNPGDFVGEMGLFDDEAQVRSAMVVAKTQCEVAEISYERFHQIRSQFPDILFAISRQMGARLRQTTRKLSDLAFVDVSGRIAHTLLDLCKEPDAMTHPDGMQIKITRQELGKIVGCSREMAGRVLKTLEAGWAGIGVRQDHGGLRHPLKRLWPGTPRASINPEKNSSRNFSPGSRRRINASPTRNACTLCSRISATSSGV